MAKFTFIDIVDFIFKNKSKYKFLEDGDKLDNFFIINKKFSIKYPERAKFFNHKNIDKVSSLDMWNLIFRKTDGIPDWYWASASKKNKKDEVENVKKLSKNDKELISKYTDLSKDDIDFLYKYYPEDIKY